MLPRPSWEAVEGVPRVPQDDSAKWEGEVEAREPLREAEGAEEEAVQRDGQAVAGAGEPRSSSACRS